MKSAKFIVIEGLEGAGKSTAIKAVEQSLEKLKISQIKKTREPGGTDLAEKLRSLVKEEHPGEVLQDMTELLLMYAARVQLVENIIKPALADGVWVIGDRHDMSSQAYQGGGRQIPRETMNLLKQTALGGFRPDLTIYLDIEPKLGLERARGRGELDRIEKMDLGFFERTRQRYLELAKENDSVFIVNASQSIVQVAETIDKLITDWILKVK
jgi:dTMP kinase